MPGLVGRCLVDKRAAETYLWKPILCIHDQQARLSAPTCQQSSRHGERAMDRRPRLTIPDYDNLSLHVWSFVRSELIMATHVV